MKLDKTLNFKKVRCVKGYGDCLEIGKEYNVIDISVEIKLKDDEGDFLYWGFDHFEPVLDPAENQLQGMELTPDFETEASEPKFKVGDKVYCLLLEPKIFTILEVDGDNDNDVQFAGEFGWASGYSCCHANQENYERLQAIFPRIEFEQPPKPLTGIELAKKLIAKGHNYLVVDTVIGIRVLTRLEGNTLIDSNNVRLDELDDITPLNDETGEPLTESVLDE